MEPASVRVSIVTPAASSALAVLRDAGRDVDQTQRRLATGLRIPDARSNAAYWSITTGLRSDAKTLAAVESALALGSATTDVAYRALMSVGEELDALSAKVLLALQDGANHETLQSDIVTMQSSLKAIAISARFSGENWLSVDSANADRSATKSIVASVGRSVAGDVELGTISFDTSDLVLLDANPAGWGILSPRTATLGTGGIVAGLAANVVSVAATHGQLVYELNPSVIDIGEMIYFELEIDGIPKTYDVAVPTGGFGGLQNLIGALDTQLGSAASASLGSNGRSIAITSKSLGSSSTVDLAKISVLGRDSDGVFFYNGYDSIGTGMAQSGIAGIDHKPFQPATIALAAFQPFRIVPGDSVSFDLTLDGDPSRMVTLDASTITRALGTGRDDVATAQDYRAVLRLALRDAGIGPVDVTLDNGALSFIRTDDVVGSLRIGPATHSHIASIVDFSIEGKTRAQIAAYLEAVQGAQREIGAAAARLGAVLRRIERQTGFVRSSIDRIDRSVSSLVDADIETEASRLRALRVREQLALQMLSIGNATSRNVLQLFR